MGAVIGDRGLGVSSPHRRLWSVVRVLLAAAALAFLGAWTGYYFGYRHGLARMSGALVMPAQDLRVELDAQRAELESIRSEAQDNLDALAVRLGEVQARLMRIEALGERIVEAAGLDEGEFDFSAPPPQGGPMHPADLEEVTQGADFLDALDEVSRQLDERLVQLDAMETILIGRRLSREVHPEGLPVKTGWVSSRYGVRKDPYTGRRAHHHGLDFAGKRGSEISAVAAGIVTWSGRKAGFGNVVELSHGNGYVTRYAHNQKNLVNAGETVRKGQKIALMGSSGRSTGTHLHFEVMYNDRPVNPDKFIRKRR
jgi:murein DD-endopeptidase MepM/ murein hydrolase activator NlpD